VAVVRAELVPERQRQTLLERTGHRSTGGSADLEIRRRPSVAHGSDNRRRGRFR
jgi:hypothetical protein